MPKPPDGYAPLLHRGSRGSLWLADDHLLVIENVRFFLAIRENYRRLDFANIQAVLHGPTRRGLVITVLLSLVLALTGSLILAEPASWPFLGFLTLLSAVLLVVHLVKGPTHKLLVCTAVKAWPIEVVTRRSHALKVAAVLAPLCRDAQAGLPALPPAQPGAADQPLPRPPAEQWPTEPYPHRLAVPGWLCLIAHAAFVAGEMVWDSLWLTGLMIGFACAAFSLLVIAFSRGGGVRGAGGKGPFFAALAVLALNLGFGYVVAMVGLMGGSLAGEGDPASTELGMVEAVARFPDGVPDEFAVVGWLLAAISLIVAILGTLAAMQQRSRFLRDRRAFHAPPTT